MPEMVLIVAQCNNTHLIFGPYNNTHFNFRHWGKVYRVLGKKCTLKGNLHVWGNL